MENSKKTVAILIVLVVILLLFSGTLVFFNLKLLKGNVGLSESKIVQDNPISSKYLVSNQQEKQSDQKIFITDKKDIPKGISGVIESVQKNQLIVRQKASIIVDYQIEKNDISKIIKLEKNPQFNQEKDSEIQKIIESKVNPILVNSKEDLLSNSEIPSEIKTYLRSPSSEPIIEKEVSWDELTSGMNLNVSSEKDGKKKFTILSGKILTIDR